MAFYLRLIFWLIFDFIFPKELRIDSGRFDPKLMRSKLLRINYSSRKSSKIVRFFYRYLMKIKNLIKIKNLVLKYKLFSYLYCHLEDNYSRKKIIRLLNGYILGFRYSKSSLNNNLYWKKRENVKNLIVKNENIKTGTWNLNLFNLNKIKCQISLFSQSIYILNIFILEQYCYKQKEAVCIKEGDYVLDAGGCWGDTALYFANKVGNLGKVYSFEFSAKNLSIFKRNLSLNPKLDKIIEIIELPLWSSSNNYFFIYESGPNSQISLKPMKKVTSKIKTITIDDFIKFNNIKKLDFIKMDIEGAELNALPGAREVIIKFKPKLAISIYHNIEHFFKIPNFIKSLNLKYKFYLDHFSIHIDETVLFAKVD